MIRIGCTFNPDPLLIAGMTMKFARENNVVHVRKSHWFETFHDGFAANLFHHLNLVKITLK